MSNGNTPDFSRDKNNDDILSVNDIQINKIEGPLVVFCGPGNIGKTVALIRLGRYIKNNEDCQIDVNQNFRPNQSDDYKATINTFIGQLNRGDIAPKRTGSVDFLLLDIYKNQSKYFQILEAPGEHFFSPDTPDSIEFKAYLEEIFASNYKKVFLFFFEPNMLENNIDYINAYSERLALIFSKIDTKKDKVIIVYNKVDEERFLFKDNNINSDEVKKSVLKRNEYRNFITVLEKNKNLKKIAFVPFSSGKFLDSAKGKKWVLSHDKYPKKLWHSIVQAIDERSGWSFF